MKSTLFLCAALMIFTSGTPCYGQHELYDTMDKEIKKVQASSDYPAITNSPEGHFLNFNTAKISDSSYLIENWSYLIYRQKGKNYLVKFIKKYPGADGKEIYRSRPIPFENDSIFDWVLLHKKEISAKDVLPFIYLDSSSAIATYRPGVALHSMRFSIPLFFRQENENILPFLPHFVFNEYDMKPSFTEVVTGSPENLNYEYNSHLKIFQVYLLFTRLMSDFDGYRSKINFEFE